VKPYTLPAATALTRPQHSGWACVFCHSPLSKGAVNAGRAEGHIGCHDLGIDVYACPVCAFEWGLIDQLPEGALR
jgi:hypothetical protein